MANVNTFLCVFMKHLLSMNFLRLENCGDSKKETGPSVEKNRK